MMFESVQAHDPIDTNVFYCSLGDKKWAFENSQHRFEFPLHFLIVGLAWAGNFLASVSMSNRNSLYPLALHHVLQALCTQKRGKFTVLGTWFSTAMLLWPLVIRATTLSMGSRCPQRCGCLHFLSLRAFLKMQPDFPTHFSPHSTDFSYSPDPFLTQPL